MIESLNHRIIESLENKSLDLIRALALMIQSPDDPMTQSVVTVAAWSLSPAPVSAWAWDDALAHVPSFRQRAES
jgi:hypothetical protein